MPPAEQLTVGLVQANSSACLETNLTYAATQIAAAAAQDCRLIVLPENILCRATGTAVRDIARPLETWTKELASLSADHGITVVWGGIPVSAGESVFNSSVCIGDDGELLGAYHKTHLFQLFLNDRPAVDECATYTHGDGSPLTISVDGWRIGLSICYDLRFPELYRLYAGVEALVCTAAFTRSTGRAHWELLLRARAVENQAYMLGVDQCGYCEGQDIWSYGHSVLIDPWGKVIAAAKDEPALLVGTLNRDRLEHCRSVLPALENRRL